LLVIAGLWANRLLEGFRSRLTADQEAARAIKAAVLDLTKKLAAGSHVISWHTWTHPTVAWITEERFANYTKDMSAVVNELVGLQASLHALDPEKYKELSRFAEQLYVKDNQATVAIRNFLDSRDPQKEKEIAALGAIYDGCLRFDRALLEAATTLLRQP
jgi:hypothetical protein